MLTSGKELKTVTMNQGVSFTPWMNEFNGKVKIITTILDLHIIV